MTTSHTITDDQIRKLVIEVVAWYKSDQIMVPEDFINLMIECGLVSESTVLGHWNEALEMNLYPRLPKSYIQ